MHQEEFTFDERPGADPAATLERRPRTIQERFEEFIKRHPDVPALFERIARQLRDAGHRRYSADGILHVVRWHRATSGHDAQGFKCNNVYSSRFARWLIEKDPSFRDFFETRGLKTE